MTDIPQHLAIRILYSDEDIIVIDKPCDLRSVPGHADPPPAGKERVNTDPQSSHRRTAQEAWVKAIQFMSADQEPCIAQSDAVVTERKDKIGNHEISMEAAVTELLHNIGSTTTNPSCVPRKLQLFVNYCNRNTKRLLPSFPELHIKAAAPKKKDQFESIPKKQKCDKSDNASTLMRSIAEASYAKIQQKQRPLMNLPKPTEDWESALGQLRLLGFGDYSHFVCADMKERSKTQNRGVEDHHHCQTSDSKLHIVHRLDCQTSGVMVIARSKESSSKLCQTWRERQLVKKIYLAHVLDWPPYHRQGLSEGTIDIPLAPSSERIKWEVCPVAKGGKECKTNWRLNEDLDKLSANEGERSAQNATNEKRGTTLELRPITGRTHQLRIHCASIGSGIVGDSLYGDSPIEWFGADANTIQKQENTANSTAGNDGISKTLRLHAHKLSFPHPNNGEIVTFESPKPW